MSGYAELAVTSNFSFLRGGSHPEELAAQAKALSLTAIGIADRNTVAGLVRAHSIAKEKELQFLPGARLVFADGTPDILAYPHRLAGWSNLTRLLTIGKRRAEKGQCELYFEDLLDRAGGMGFIVAFSKVPTLPLREGRRRLRAITREDGFGEGTPSTISPPRNLTLVREISTLPQGEGKRSLQLAQLQQSQRVGLTAFLYQRDREIIALARRDLAVAETG